MRGAEVVVAHLDSNNLQNFKIFRALGLSIRGWIANFIPITLLAAVIYAPIVVWVVTLPGPAQAQERGVEALDAYVTFFNRGTWALIGASTLLSPLLTYRIVQWMNGKRASMGTSLKYGLRGILPAAFLAGATNLLGFVPAGGILGAIITCIWFVAAPAAVAEKLNPVAAIGRSTTLTEGRRGGIFLLNFLVGIIVVGVIMGVVAPLLTAPSKSPEEILTTFKHVTYFLVGLIAVFQILIGVLQAVSYALLRTDKEGISNEDLAAIFG